MKRYGNRLALMALIGGVTWAQGAPPPAPAAPLASGQDAYRYFQPVPSTPPAPGVMPWMAPGGRWWSNAAMAKTLGVTADQQKKMDDIFQQYRLRLIDLNASLQKQELIMEPMLKVDQPDEAKVLAQIDKVAQARAELEKSDARMLLEIRRVLTAEQWQKLQSEGKGARLLMDAPPRPIVRPVRK